MDTFEELRQIAALSHVSGQDAIARERLVRLLDVTGAMTPDQPIIDSLCARFGLYPYMGPADNVGVWEAFAIELHSPPELSDQGFTFHAEQQQVYQRLMDGESVILSAPTSFGKSAIIDALLASERWSNLVLVVPTIALIDETRRRVARHRSNYRLITHPSEKLGKRNIVIMTQERLLEMETLPSVDFFMIDEFYKLGTGRKNDSRRTMLNLAWRRLRATGAQYYLIGPNVDDLDSRLPDGVRSTLVRSDFRPVAVDVEDRSHVKDQLADLKDFIARSAQGPTLVFTGSPRKAEALSLELRGSVSSVPTGMASLVAGWIADNYDPAWDVVTALRAGIAVHTGPLPRSLQRIMVRLFDDELVSLLVCTSTLIEGVNTAARNVVIFEKKIDGQLIDFFTFSNIRGRAGRMSRHFVGRVVTYMPPPEAEATTVDIPIETQSSLASDADLVQLDEEVLEPEASERLSHVMEQDDLSLTTIRKNRGIDPSAQISTAQRMSRMSAPARNALSWSGYPTTDQAKRTLQFAFENLLQPYQRTGTSFNSLWGKLQNARFNADSLKAQVDQQMRYARPGQTRSEIVTETLKFHRNWMGFTIPSMLRGLQAIQSEVVADAGLGSRANYEFLIREVENLYRPNGLLDLEELGLPSPLGMRLMAFGLRGEGANELAENLVQLSKDPAVVSNLSAVEQWILTDVVDGIMGI